MDSYRKDADCQGNQRATARKYGIHRRQIQKWLQTETSLRLAVQQGVGASKPAKIAAVAASALAAPVVVESASGTDSDINVEDFSDAEDSALDLSTTCLDLTKRKRDENECGPCKRRPLAPVASIEQPLYVNPVGYPYVDYPLYYCWPPCCYRPCYVERPVPQRLTCSLDLKVYTCEQKEPSLLDISYPPQHWNKQDYRFSSSL